MHSTLKPKNNLRLIVIWGVVGVFTAVFLSHPMLWLFYVAGMLMGVIGGLVQLRALRQSTDLLIAANDMMSVRRALTASRSGRVYIAIFWLSNITIVVMAIVIMGSSMIGGWLAGFCTFGFTRELITLRETYELTRLSTSG
jgi:hypothetical protein